MVTAKKQPRISKYYKLGASQPSLDFVDVRTLGDTQLFLDPTVIASIDSLWTNACTSAIQSFFQAVLDAIIAGDTKKARALLSPLGEDNSTRLGYSSSSKGSGVGAKLADHFYEELSNSRAVATGLVRDIEDTALLIEGVREDRISDVVTNVIRHELVTYTQQAAAYYGIPLVKGLVIGPRWDVPTRSWQNFMADLPMPKKGGPLLLVPKAIVRRKLACDPGAYYRYSILPFLQEQEIRHQSPLVQMLKSGEPRVTKKSVERKYREKHGAGRDNPGVEKRINLDGTNQNPHLLTQFKETQSAKASATKPEVIAEGTGTKGPDLDALLAAVKDCVPGHKDATKYEHAIEALLSALFYPTLVNPIRQENIHDGRKRIDITFTNAGKVSDFFGWCGSHFPAANIAVECKNFSGKVGNEELDQIGGRFSPSRGQVGVLVARNFVNKDKMIQCCKDTVADARGYIIPLDDDDLEVLVQEAKVMDEGAVTLTGLLRERFRKLTN